MPYNTGSVGTVGIGLPPVDVDRITTVLERTQQRAENILIALGINEEDGQDKSFSQNKVDAIIEMMHDLNVSLDLISRTVEKI